MRRATSYQTLLNTIAEDPVGSAVYQDGDLEGEVRARLENQDLNDFHSLRDKITFKKKCYFKSNKQKIPINVLPDKDDDVKPIFTTSTFHPEYTKKKHVYLPCSRRKLLWSTETDEDLVYELKIEAAFVPRDQSLLLLLKQKAKKFMDKFDCSLITMKQRYEIIVNAVCASFLISKEEEKVRKILDAPHEKNRLRPAHNAFLKDGKTGVTSSTSLAHIPGKESVVGEWLRDKLTPVIGS